MYRCYYKVHFFLSAVLLDGFLFFRLFVARGADFANPGLHSRNEQTRDIISVGVARS